MACSFHCEGGTEGNEAEIISQSENEIVVKVPYVESDKAIVTFKYFDGTKEVNRKCLEQANQIIEDGIDAQKLYLLSSTE